MYHTGLGETHVSSFLAALEIPHLHHKTMKQREREIAKSIDKVAKESSLRVLEEEREKSLQKKGYEQHY
jgi:hypothetical protein